MTTQLKAIGIVITLALIAMPAARAEFYVGFGVGAANVQGGLAKMGTLPQGEIPPPSPLPPGYEAGVAGDVAAASSDFSDTDIGTLFAVGWRSRYFGVEVGYTNFNQMSRSEATEAYALPNAPLGCVPGQGGPTQPTGCQEREWRANYSADGYQAALLGYLPVGESIELFAKAGAIVWESEQSASERVRVFGDNPGIDGPRNDPVAAKDDGTDFMFGLGVNFLSDSPFAVRLAADYYAIGNTDQIITYTATLTYSWGKASRQ
jgi:hypothetical protein